MARRARSSAHSPRLIAAFCLLTALMGGGYWLHLQLNDPFRTLAHLPVAAYLDNSNTLRGNVYRISGIIDNQLDSSPTIGRLYSIDLDESSDILPLLFPPGLNAINLQKGQRFTIEVEVGEHGLLYAKNLIKA